MRMYRFLIAAILLATAGNGWAGADAPEAGTFQMNEELAKRIVEKNFVFVPYMAQSPDGATQQVSGSVFRVKPDSLISSMPYFGLRHSATANQADEGIKFNSTTFEYTAKARKKGGYDITIRPRNVRDVHQIYITIYPDGKAQLQVMSSNRQPISFMGVVS
jgi:hypothetical protein